jgi:large conductance mechanosensitive channel
MLKEFREFIARGSLIEIAVGFVMGAAFGQVVTTLTGRIVSPLIGMIANVSALDGMWTFGPVDLATGLPQGSIGAFVGALINFVIVALVMFFVVRGYNSLRREPETVEATPEDVALLREIRDLLKVQP